MIDAQSRKQLADVVAVLKRQNEGYYRMLGQALAACVEPEHKLLVAAPADTVLKQQGRTQFGVELLEIVYDCERIAGDATTQGQGPRQPALTL